MHQFPNQIKNDLVVAELLKGVNSARQAIEESFPQNLFQWQLIEARHLLRGVSELNLIKFSALTQELSRRSVDALLPITEYWKVHAEQVGLLHYNIQELYSESCPHNLSNLTFNEIIQVVKTARQQHVGLPYVLPIFLVNELLNSPSMPYDDFSTLLMAHQSDIFLQVRTELSKSSRNERFKDRSNFLLEAIACYENGHTAAAQTLAVTVLDTHLLDVQPISNKPSKKTSAQLRNRVDNRKIEMLDELQGWLTFYECIVVMAVENIFTTKNNTEKLSRNHTIHNLNTAQVREENVLRSVLAASSLVVHDSIWC